MRRALVPGNIELCCSLEIEIENGNEIVDIEHILVEVALSYAVWVRGLDQTEHEMDEVCDGAGEGQMMRSRSAGSQKSEN